jgi:hypothetical protein
MYSLQDIWNPNGSIRHTVTALTRFNSFYSLIVVLKEWIPDPSSRIVVFLFVFMYFWTTCLLSYTERYIIARTVTQWYFHHTDSEWLYNEGAQGAARRAFKFHFGSLSFAALILSTVRFLRWTIHLIKRATRSQSNLLVSILASSCGLVESAIEDMNSYALVFMANSDKGLLPSAKQCGRLFREHIIGAFVLNMLTKAILLSSAFIVSAVAFMITLNMSSSYVVEGGSLWLISIIGSVIPFYITRYCSYIILQILDALYVAFVMDMDTGTCHDEHVHAFFRDNRKPLYESIV